MQINYYDFRQAFKVNPFCNVLIFGYFWRNKLYKYASIHLIQSWHICNLNENVLLFANNENDVSLQTFYNVWSLCQHYTIWLSEFGIWFCYWIYQTDAFVQQFHNTMIYANWYNMLTEHMSIVTESFLYQTLLYDRNLQRHLKTRNKATAKLI